MVGIETNRPSQAVYRGMKGAGIDFVASVPCINLRGLLCMIEADPEIMHIPVTREEEGLGYVPGRASAAKGQLC